MEEETCANLHAHVEVQTGFTLERWPDGQIPRDVFVAQDQRFDWLDVFNHLDLGATWSDVKNTSPRITTGREALAS